MICRQIVEDFGNVTTVTEEGRRRFEDELQNRLGDRYQIREEIGTGRTSSSMAHSKGSRIEP